MPITKSLWQSHATRLGEKLAKEQNFSSFPIDPFHIANELKIVVEPLPDNKEGVSGMLLFNENKFGIMYATYIKSRGFKNFCLSHELAHYSIPGHPEALLNNGVHFSKGGFTSSIRAELEADHFAAGLLMPSYLFDKELNKVKVGMKAVISLANTCKTSLPATAIRYAQRTHDPIAIIISQGEIINYCFMSDEMKEIRGLKWIKKNTPLSRNTLTYEFNKLESNIIHSNQDEDETTLLDWFNSELDYQTKEEVIGLGSYKKTLTVITIEDLPDQEDIDEENDLIESLTPRFKY